MININPLELLELMIENKDTCNDLREYSLSHDEILDILNYIVELRRKNKQLTESLEQICELYQKTDQTDLNDLIDSFYWAVFIAHEAIQYK